MRHVLELKIGNSWVVLAEDTNISIEMTSPLWNDSGTFSYSFQVPYYANRHIFNASDKPENDVNLKTFRERFELYLNGIGFFFGYCVCPSEEIDTESDRIDLELRSAYASFEDTLDGKTLQDLDLGKTVIGKLIKRNRVYNHTVQAPTDYGIDLLYADEENLPYAGFTHSYSTRHNGSAVFPAENYINIPIIVNGLEGGDTNKKKPAYLSPYRAFSSPCFFVAYLLEQIFKQHSYPIVQNEWNEVEDLKRLILLNMHYLFEEEETSKEENTGTIEFRYGEDSSAGGPRILNWPYWEWLTHYDLTAKSENLPSTSLTEFVNALKNAFGLRILIDNDNKVQLRFLRNIFRSKEVKKITISEVLDVYKMHTSFDGIHVKYSQEDEGEFQYKEYKNIKAYENYELLLKDWVKLKDIKTPSNPYTELLPIEEDTLLRIDKETGNFYRTKVDKDTFDEAQLFEVAQYNAYEVEGYTDEDKPEEHTIGFQPITPTLIDTTQFASFTERPIPTEAFYVGADVSYNKDASHVLELPNAADKVFTGCQSALLEELKNLLDYDCGFMMGIVRTSPEGNLSDNYTEVKQNVDGFGNAEWVRTLCTTTVTNDSVGRDGSLFDYNGTEEGIGVPTEQLVSLKLWSGKQNLDPSHLAEVDSEGNSLTGADVYNNNPTGPLPNRGLVPQFLSEYLHFRKNRKPITLVGNIHVSELLNIEWDKYYEVDGYHGLLDKIKFSVSMNGMSEVTVEHFLI